jgi:DNA-binding MarR family transcriptional regulator
MDLALEIAGLTNREYAVLALLEAARGPMAQVTIGYRLRRDRSTVMRTVGSLERKGFVSRGPDLDDRRIDVVAMTARGADALTTGHCQLDAADLEFFAYLTADERGRLLSMLARLGGPEPTYGPGSARGGA